MDKMKVNCPSCNREFEVDVSKRRTKLDWIGWVPLIGSGHTFYTILGSMILIFVSMCLITGQGMIFGFTGRTPGTIYFGYYPLAGQLLAWAIILDWTVPINVKRLITARIKMFVKQLRHKKEDNNVQHPY